MEVNKNIPTNKKDSKAVIIIVFLIILFVSIGLYYLLDIRQKAPGTISPKSTTESVATSAGQVSITKYGFSPATIIIKQGQSITWLNNDTAPHWIASDPHPTHQNLPGFDSIENIGLDESFTYPFEKTGTFTYHDHLNPLKLRGTVIVE